MDQHGCAENDPNSPVFDPVHGVIHHFYQEHLAAAPGHGPVYGHFVSKDFVNWAQLPVAVWNGLDSSVTPPRVTKYDNIAIYTGSAFVLDGAGPDGKGPGIVHIYPGLCDAKDWPQCKTGCLLAQAVPADYANDELLINWTKPTYNPIVENTQRDPSSPWKTPSGEWRFRTYDSQVYAASSDADVLAGKWYHVGMNKDFRTCECPSLYPLPASTPGFEAAYNEALYKGSLPTHVHKTSCAGDWWQLGTYKAGKPGEPDSFHETPGWEDAFVQKRMDMGPFYASKDNEYPTKTGGKRRINWGWVQIPNGVQSLPRVITFNAAARTLEQAPMEELENLRGKAAFQSQGLEVTAGKPVNLNVPKGFATQSEVIASFSLPDRKLLPATISVIVGAMTCTIDFVSHTKTDVECGGVKDNLRLLDSEREVEIRIFTDWTFSEIFFQKGRTAMTVANIVNDDTTVSLASSIDIKAASVVAFPIKGIWTTPEAVRNAPRVYPLDPVTVV